MTCCDLWGNASGDWTSRIADQYGVRGNISACPFFCNPDSLELYVAGDSPCAPSANPDCGLIGAWGVGCDHVPAAVAAGDATLAQTRLIATPNPSAGRTEISFPAPPGIPQSSIVLEIYDLGGRVVRRLQPTAGSNGELRLFWDGRDSGGRSQAGGIYFVRWRGGKESGGSRLVVLH